MVSDQVSEVPFQSFSSGLRASKLSKKKMTLLQLLINLDRFGKFLLQVFNSYLTFFSLPAKIDAQSLWFLTCAAKPF
jgi:hypothetical protein